MQRLACREIEIAQAVEIEAVVDVSAVGGAAPLGDQPGISQPAQVVTDQVERLTEHLHQLVHPIVAARKRRKGPPAHIVGQYFQKVRGRQFGRRAGPEIQAVSSAHVILQTISYQISL